MEEEKSEVGLSKEQKIGFVLLLFFAVFALGLGVLQIRNTMYAPFALDKSVPTAHKEDINSAEALAYRDTDKDQLNDFDEIYVYQTSAYLVDTDSDGIPDNVEVAKGTNPLCPEGKTCDDLENPAAIPASMQATSSLKLSGSAGSIEELIKMSGGAKELRQQLLSAGMDSKVLEKVSDEDLMRLVKQFLNTTEATGTAR